MNAPRVTMLPAALLGSTQAILYAEPAGDGSAVKAAILMNATPTTTAVTIQIVRAAGGSNVVLAGMQLVPGQAYAASELMGQSLAPGDAIMGVATVDASASCTLVVGAP